MEVLPQFLFLGLLIGVFYFMLIRPQKKRAEQHRNLIDSVAVGDEIVTIGGLHGRVTRLGDDDLEIEASPGTKLRFVKSAIARKVTEDSDEEIGATSEEE
ncbi:MAG: preprotein translocase subunit YajC [Actinomycetota bacterium]